jgi:hypothetical protein
MNISRNLLLSFVVFSGCVIISCSPRDKYDNQLREELSSGIRYDSLFMGLYLGMPEKDFYIHCWKLNKKGLVRQGASNTTVMYQIKEELNFPGQMDFYPRFNQGKIFEMPVRFQYNGWAPWNKKLSAERLQEDVVDWYEQVYGKGFIRVRHPEWGLAYVKLDGNRRITILREDNMHVWAVFTDMLVKSDWSGINRDTITKERIR